MADPNVLGLALQALTVRSAAYRTYGEYHDGIQPLAFATERFRNIFGKLFRAFPDNLCGNIIAAVVDRLDVEGFEVEAGDQDGAKLGWQIWQENRLDLRSAEVHQESALYGDSYVIVWPGDQDQPEIFPNDAALTTVHYSTERRGQIDWAAKWWRQDDNRIRVTLYYPDRIEKYVTTSAHKDEFPTSPSAFIEADVPGEPWPLPNPYDRVPVFHFGNNARTGQFGRSELADVIPLQDALNKSIADLMVAMEFISFPQRYATGLEVSIDPDTGKPISPFIPGPERIWAVGATDAKFGEFSQADMNRLLGVSDAFRLEIARVTRTPLHYLLPTGGGQWPSGESLKTAEAPFLAKIAGKQLRFGSTWEDVISFAVQIAKGPQALLSTVWKDTAPRSELQTAQVAQIKDQIGVSFEQVCRELGYSEDQIAKMIKDKAAALAALPPALPNSFPPSNGRQPVPVGGPNDGRFQ